MRRSRDSWVRRRGVAAAIALAVVASACGGASGPEAVETSASDNGARSAEIATTAPVETPPAPAAPAPAETAAQPPVVASNPEPMPTLDAATESDTSATSETPSSDSADNETAAAYADDSNSAVPDARDAGVAAAPTEVATPPPADPTTVPAQVAIQLPSVDVVSLATGQTANLSTFAKPGPTLVWFWAPH